MTPQGLRVLLLNQYFPPDRSATASVAEQAVTALKECGHDVTVVVGRPSYRPVRRANWRPIRFDRLHGAHVRCVGSTAFNRARIAGRVINYVTYCLLALIAGVMRRTDAVLVMTDPPVVVFVAQVIAFIHRAPVVYWVQDLHPDMAIAAGLISDGGGAALWRRMHRLALRRCDATIVLGEDMAQRVVHAGAQRKHVHVIPSGAPLVDKPEPADRMHPVVQRLRGSADFVVMHAGNIGFAGAWESLIQAVELVGDTLVQLVFLGEGPERKRLERLAEGKPVRFEDFLPPSDARYFFAAGDLQVVTLRPELTGVLVPSKLYGIMAAGRPILAVVSEDSHAARVVRRHECGLVVDPARPEAIAEAIAWARSHQGSLTEMGEQSRRAAQQYNQKAQISRVVALVEIVCSRPN